MALAGSTQLLATMNFTEIETDVFVYLESDVIRIAKYASMIDDALMPVRMEFMTPEEKQKQAILIKRKHDMQEKHRKEQEHHAQLKKLAEYDRIEKAQGPKAETSVGNKMTFGANI